MEENETIGGYRDVSGGAPGPQNSRTWLGLPHDLRDYLKSPVPTVEKISSWVNARWQLRKATSLGRWTRVAGKVYVENDGEMFIGDRVQIRSHYARTVLVTYPGGKLEIGDRSLINYGTDISVAGSVSIGKDCLIGTHVTILDTNFHDVEDHSWQRVGQPVVIEDGVWIGNRAIILPGVTIGTGSTIGAGAVVTRNVLARSVVAGNPARVIKEFKDRS